MRGPWVRALECGSAATALPSPAIPGRAREHGSKKGGSFAARTPRRAPPAELQAVLDYFVAD